MRTFLAVIVVVLTVASGWSALYACGDKLLIVGRGVRYGRAYAAVYPGRILIYAHQGTPTAGAIRAPQVQQSLRQAGHQVTVVEDAASLEKAIAEGKYDIVLADAPETPLVTRQAASVPSNPTVVPVLDDSNKEQAKIIQKQCNCRLKASDKATRYLMVVDDAMKARNAAASPQKKG
jgi:hypothetical protein